MMRLALLLAIFTLPALPAFGGSAKQPTHGTVTAGNPFYKVHVQDIPGLGVGQYTATTGPFHPAGEGLNVLYGDGNPGTTFNTIRSYTSRTDYVQDTSPKSSPHTVVSLDAYGVVTPLGATGFRTTYTLPGPPTTPDALTIVQDVRVNGDTFENSTIEITTTILNRGPSSASIGVRYFLDYQVGTDDGPIFQGIGASQGATAACDETITEAEFTLPAFDAYRIEDNDVNPAPPTFNIFGTVTGPDTVTPTPTPPDLVQFVCWPSAVGTAFEYTIDPTRDIATAASDCQSGTGGGDTALSYFFGRNQANAIVIPAGGSHTVSISLFLTPPTPGPTTCITRDARFWFSHADSAGPACVTLKSAIRANCDVLGLGFLSLPIGYRNDDNLRDAEDALIEALGLFWRSGRKTGETAGTQNQGLRGAMLCRQRKRLAAELIAAIANKQLFGTDPVNCTYFNGITHVNFPANLIQQARLAAAGADVDEIRALTVLLRRFNASGLTNDFPAGLVQCLPQDRKTLRQLGRDPTTQNTCPGVNNTCGSAETVIFPNAADPFAPAVFTRTVDLSKYTDAIGSPGCGAGGRDAVWRVLPDVGVAGRRFTVETAGSNFDTMASIWRGTCDSLLPVDCNDNEGLGTHSKVSFTTDGTNTFYIVVEGPTGNYGQLKLKVTSP